MRADAQRSSAANSDGSATRGSVFGRIFSATRASSLSVDGSSAPSHRRARGRKLALLSAAVLALCLALAPAASAVKRNHQSTFGSFGFFQPAALTVDQQNGDIYAVDSGAGSVYRFDSNGNPKDFTAGPDSGTNTLTGFSFDGGAATQLAVDRSSGATDGDIYVTDSFGVGIAVFENDGTPSASLDGTSNPNAGYSEACGVAVNQANGDVYVGDIGGNVWRYTPSGSTVAEGDYSGGIDPGFGPCQVAAQGANVYAAEWGTGPLNRFAASDFAAGPPPSPAGALVTATATAIAIDPTTGEVYADEGTQVSVFAATGNTALYRFGSGDFSLSNGVAVKGAGGPAYVADPSFGSRHIDVYGPFAPSEIHPTALTRPAAGIKKAHATLRGRLDTNGGADIIDCHFDWGTTVGYGNSAPCDQGNDFTDPAEVDATITGLTPGETYHFRLSVDTSRETVTGVDRSFETPAVEPQRLQAAEFGPDGTSASTFTALSELALRQSTQGLYAVDQGPPSGVFGFDVSSPPSFSLLAGFAPLATSALDNDTTIGVDNTALSSAGNVYVTDASGVIHGFDSSGAPLGGNFPIDPATTPGAPAGSPKDLCGTAVDSTGDLWISNFSTGKVLRYSSSGVFESALDTTPQGLFPCRIAFAPNDDLYVTASASGGGAYRYTAASGYTTSTLFQSSGVGNIVVNPSNSHVFTLSSGGTAAREYDDTGTLLRQFATGIPGANFRGLAIDEASDHVYVADKGNGVIRVFAPESIVPDAITGEGTPLSASSALLDGAANPNGVALTECRFEYVADAAFIASGFTDLASGGDLPCDQAPGSISADFEEHAVTATVTGLDPETLYHFRLVVENAGAPAAGDGALIPTQPLVETTGSPTRTATTARLDSRVLAHGLATTYRFEYGDQGPCSSNPCTATATHQLPLQSADEVQRLTVSATGGEFRLLFDGEPTGDLAFNVAAAEVETALEGLTAIGPGNVEVSGGPGDAAGANPYTIRFTGSLAEADVTALEAENGMNPLTGSGSAVVSTLTEGQPQRAGDGVVFVSQQLTGLQPGTTYNYRVIADNGNPDGAAAGEDRSFTTRASDAPLTHGAFPGPPGSDRAWELVSLPDTSGNKVNSGLGFSDDGDKALYGIDGGSPGSEYGGGLGGFNYQYTERTAAGWQPTDLYPTRAQAPANQWLDFPLIRSDLTQLYDFNKDVTNVGPLDIWRLRPGQPPEQVFSLPYSQFIRRGDQIVSDDNSRIIIYAVDTVDPDHPVGPETVELYDVSTGTPHMVGLLPNGSVPSCGASPLQGTGTAGREDDWITPDGSDAFFEARPGASCTGTPSLYRRDLDDSTTTLIADDARLIRFAAGGAFFTTLESLAPDDPAGNDVYRYNLGNGDVDCLTCLAGHSGFVDESLDRPSRFVGVSDDASRIYFPSKARLLPGAPSAGVYRLDVASGDLAYVAPGGQAGEYRQEGRALTPDGSVFTFTSSSSDLNALNGQQNGGTRQLYRYDDTDRSLVCVSCPDDGSAPRGDVPPYTGGKGENATPLTADGDVAFSTPTGLIAADQNTAKPSQSAPIGDDVYEWRDGRLLLVTDGQTRSLPNASGLSVEGFSASGRDLFFLQAAALTPDAIDTPARLYDARVGGGIEFPEPESPCPLEVCQGTPRGAPDDPSPASSAFSGRGNVAEPADCAPSERAAKRLRRSAARLRRAAKRASSAKRAKAMRRKAARLSSAAKKKHRRAKRCRANNNRRTAR